MLVMSYIKLITDNKERKRLGSNSIIQEFDDSDTPTTPILRPFLDSFGFNAKSLEIVRYYEPKRQMIDQARYDYNLRTTLKTDRYIHGECLPLWHKEDLKIRVLANKTSDYTPRTMDKITFFICSADVKKAVFYSGDIGNRQLRTDIYLNHQEFIKLENAIEKQSIKSSYIRTSFKGLYSNSIDYDQLDELYYLPVTSQIDVKDSELINKNSDRSYKYKLEVGNDLHSEKNKPLSQVEFNYRIEQKFNNDDE
jgi:hypothetical protein